ncbi:lipid II flippase MurJ [Chitinivibrio alkaliphilus]|uniref:MviN protein n=1 Tax=Chitinivibrio alkaliphilus ACht1 TaxID=1313304 RepID=U7DAT3_9BACT|nr:lipid II flippase MurJ [Chitinivibrio alkaliphilus]ERP31510.1 MviN protein [Chitinivibrio alkaliphilus ACht1]
MNSYVRGYIAFLAPIFVGRLLMRLIKISDVFLASFMEEGAVSYLSYATRITGNLDQLYVGILVVYFPIISQRANDSEQQKGHADTIFEGFELLFLASFSVALFLTVFAPDIVRLLFQRGAFLPKDTAVVANILRFYSLMMVCAPLGSYFANAYYSSHQPRRATYYSVIASVLNVVLNVIFFIFWGVYGIAAASSLAFLTGFFLQSYNLHKVNENIIFSSMLWGIEKICFVACLSMLPVYLLSIHINTETTVGTLWQLGILFALYGIGILLLTILFRLRTGLRLRTFLEETLGKRFK